MKALLLPPRLTLVTLTALLLASCQPRASGPEAADSAGSAAAADSAAAAPHLVYVGTGSGNPDHGIYALRFDPATGALTQANDVTPLLNPSFLALSPDAQFLYAISESSKTSTVRAYRVNDETGALTFLNQQAAGGQGPAYVSTDRTGQWVLVANYGSGSVALLPVRDGGRLGAPADVVQHEGSGPNPDRQQGPHAHYIHVSPDNRYAYATDLGTDQVLGYTLDTEQGSLTSEPVVEIDAEPGAGPRHLDFHPNGRYVYLVSELSGTVTAYDYDAATGKLAAIQTLSALPEGFEGQNSSADIHVHPSGRWLYVSNRGDSDGLARFTIDEATGRLTFAGYQRENIRWPRNFAIAPGGRHLLVANRRANEITVFTLDPDTGALTPTDHRLEVPEPTNITFVAPSAGSAS